jgi:hypothetical protein
MSHYVIIDGCTYTPLFSPPLAGRDLRSLSARTCSKDLHRATHRCLAHMGGACSWFEAWSPICFFKCGRIDTDSCPCRIGGPGCLASQRQLCTFFIVLRIMKNAHMGRISFVVVDARDHTFVSSDMASIHQACSNTTCAQSVHALQCWTCFTSTCPRPLHVHRLKPQFTHHVLGSSFFA